MKKQVLFVDDEPLVLEGLKRMLRPLRHEWDMHFAGGGEEALALMDRTPIQVVVSDMRMPRMNGAQLLNLVMKRHPQTVRLILSGYADRDLILKCVGSTHQYLSKPCDPEALRATVARAADLEASLQNERLRQLIGQMENLPSLPSLYGEIVEKTQDADVTLDEIGDTIARDLAMTAKILKLVNSAFFGLRREISSLTDAIAYLGIDTIKSLVLTVNAFSQFEGQELEALPIEKIWAHSMEVALYAQKIARAEGADAKIVQEAFAAGMLHDLGKLILAFNFPADYLKLLAAGEAGGEPLTLKERTVFGADHADVGGALLGLWGLPVPVVEAIALHHQPSRALIRQFTALTAVVAANALARDPGGGALLGPANLEYFKEMKLSDRFEHWKEAIAATDMATA